jgi:hypothetical protein
MYNMNRILLWLLPFTMFISMAMISGCTPSAGRGIEKDGKLYGVTDGVFRHRWWNYYERGLSFSDGQFYPEALADFQASLADRENDQRMARTYGMHFVDYFPHRESGVIYYFMGNLDVSKKELELSLSQFPTAKAQFYLDRVRKAILEKTVTKAGPPSLKLNPDAENIWTRDDPVMLSGTVESDLFVSAVSINKKPLFMEGAKTQVKFQEKLTLSQGRHAVDVEAKNLLGGVAKRRMVFHVDREGPMITVEEMKQHGDKIHLRAFVSDASSLAGIILNHRKLVINHDAEQDSEIFLDESFEKGNEPVEISATDRLGNTTVAHLSLPQPSVPSVSRLSAGLTSDMNPYLAASETQPPHIRLSDWSDQQTVYLEKIYVSGQAEDDGRIESLTVNSNQVLRRKGRSIYFNTLIELHEGKNIVSIEAKDESGNTAKKEFTVNREIPQALQLSERLKLTVMPFDQKGVVAQASLAYYDSLINSLEARNRFQIVERDKLDAVLQEQKLSKMNLVDGKTALRLGKLVAAQSIITGTIIETKTGIEIVGRMIDTETSEIMTTKDVYDENRDISAIKLLAEGMSIQLVQEFPLVGGIVLQSKGKDIFTDLGEGKIALKRRLIVYREEPITHPVTGKIMGSDNVIIGKAIVSQVSPEMSKAEMITASPADIKKMDIKKMEKVITE